LASWRTLLAIAMATAFGTIVLVLCLVLVESNLLLFPFGSLSRFVAYEVSVLAVFGVCALLARADLYTALGLAVSAFAGVLVSTWVGTLLKAESLPVRVVLLAVAVTLTGFPVTGLISAILNPEVSLRKLAFIMGIGITLFWLATAWVVFACWMFLDTHRSIIPMPIRALAPLLALFGFPLALAVTATLLVNSLNASRSSRSASRQTLLCLVAAAISTGTIVVLLLRAPRCARTIDAIDAICRGDAVEAHALLQSPVELNSRDMNGDTLLHYAAIFGSADIAELLIQKGAFVDSRTAWGKTPLWCAAHAGQKDVAQVLIARGADVNAMDIEGRSALHAAMLAPLLGRSGPPADQRREVVALLIASGARLNVQDEDGKTPLDIAEENNNKEMAALLRKHGAKTGKELDQQPEQDD